MGLWYRKKEASNECWCCVSSHKMAQHSCHSNVQLPPRQAGDFDQHPKNHFISLCREHRTQTSMFCQVHVANSCFWLHRNHIKAKATLAFNFSPPVFYSSLNLTCQEHVLSMAPYIWRMVIEWEVVQSLSSCPSRSTMENRQQIAQNTRGCLSGGGRVLEGLPLNAVLWRWILPPAPFHSVSTYCLWP